MGTPVMDTKFSERAKKLLSDLEGKAITQDEFQREVSYWALMDGWEELRPRSYPQKPEKVIEFERKVLEQGVRYGPTYFQEYPEVLEYYNSFQRTAYHNRSTYEWIMHIKKNIPTFDTARHEKIDIRIGEFKAFFSATNGMVDTAKRVLGAREASEALHNEGTERRREPQPV